MQYVSELFLSEITDEDIQRKQEDHDEETIRHKKKNLQIQLGTMKRVVQNQKKTPSGISSMVHSGMGGSSYKVL